MGCGDSILKARELIPFLDIAYQGFGAVWKRMPTPFAPLPALDYPLCEQFVLENFLPLRRARRRTFLLCEDAEAAGRVLGQLKATVAATTPARRILVRRWWLRC